MRRSRGFSTFPRRENCEGELRANAEVQILGTFPSSSSTAGSRRAASDPPCSETAASFFLMRQNDRTDLEDISQDIALPDITKQTIMSYPLPDQQTGQNSPPSPTSMWTHCVRYAARCITVASPEMLVLQQHERGTFRPAPHGNSSNTRTSSRGSSLTANLTNKSEAVPSI